MLILANIIMVIGSIIGMYLIAHKDKRGFVVFLTTEIALVYIGAHSGNYGLVATAFIYLSMNVYSYTKWSTE